MNEADRNRHIDSLMCVFDLDIQAAVRLEKKISTRVLFLYDRKKAIETFQILDKTLPDEIYTKIMTWFQVNMICKDTLLKLNGNNMNADSHSLDPDMPHA